MTSVILPSPSNQPAWVDIESVARLDPPPALASWLTQSGLLTERLQHTCQGEFGLQLVSERLGPPDRLLIDRVDNIVGLNREVLFTCDSNGLVFARTSIASAILTAFPWLESLGEQALGPTLARHGCRSRGPLEVACVPAALCRLPANITEQESVWCRRYPFLLEDESIWVLEFFLPGLATHCLAPAP
jgi:chorismate-pyruvate lyase